MHAPNTNKHSAAAPPRRGGSKDRKYPVLALLRGRAANTATSSEVDLPHRHGRNNDRRQGRRRHLHRRAMAIVPLPPICHRADRDRAKPCPRISCGGGQEVYSDAPSRGKISSSFFQHTNSYIILQKLQLPNKLIPTSAGPPEVGKFNFPGSCLILARTRGGLIVESLRWMPTSPPLH